VEDAGEAAAAAALRFEGALEGDLEGVPDAVDLAGIAEMRRSKDTWATKAEGLQERKWFERRQQTALSHPAHPGQKHVDRSRAKTSKKGGSHFARSAGLPLTTFHSFPS
jgi:hypothetical protein